jgi:hypothetical protein
VCTYPKIEDLKVTPEIVQNAVNFLVEKKRDDKAAYGLLRLVYVNNISMTFLGQTVLVKFQDDYEQVILRFFKSISPLESQIIDSLPPSAFCFTTPVLQALRDKGCSFSTRIPYQFMPFVIQIACYSFTESIDSFRAFLDKFRDGVKNHFNSLVLNRFKDLLQAILDETIAVKPKFFGSLDYSSSVLERAFGLLKQR